MSRNVILFNANGSIGLNVAETPDYPRLEDFLREMDRLGIAQALVWNKSSVPHAPGGNRRLLESISACPAARNRIFPALVIAPAMLYEKGALDDLVETMRRERIRALRALPKDLYYDLRQLEFLLKHLARFKPVLMVHSRDIGDGQPLLFLAERFPAMKFIITEAMWGDMGRVFDCMRRQRNILAETSWMHTQGTLDLLAREFGPERIVFGMGPRSHAGAAIAGLLNGGLDRKTVCMAARGNMAGILGLKAPPPAVKPAGKSDNSFWKKLLRGERLGVPVIDAHSHLGPSSRWYMEEGDSDAMVRQMLARMDRIGVDLTVTFPGSNPLADDVVAGNEFLEKLTLPHHGRLKGMVSFHPAYAGTLAGKLDEYFARDFFVGFKILCSYWKVPVTDPVFTPAWEYAGRHRLPILIHSWGSGGLDSPGRLEAVVKRHPRAIFILGHSGGNDAGRPEAEALALAHRNVYLEWCGSFCSTHLWEKTIEKVGNRKIVFGTDAVYHSIDWELGRLLSLDVPDKIISPILGANMRGILSRRLRRD